LKTSVIIPVKTFKRSKTRLGLTAFQTELICRLFLEEVIKTVSNSKFIDQIIVVTKEEKISDLIEKYECVKIIDEDEENVNNAVSLSEKYLKENAFTHSIVLPSDLPFFYPEDIDEILRYSSEDSVLVVPSRHFDGTNALLRCPIDSMVTRYDEGSYSFQIQSARENNIRISVGLIYRLMLDVDDYDDLEFVLKHNIKPELCDRIKQIINQ
tara:strand:+ start:953 stop:1585 length:633 start_codon:yes stop_codon:yes gene_type:complete